MRIGAVGNQDNTRTEITQWRTREENYAHTRPRPVDRTMTRECVMLNYAVSDRESDWSFRLAHWSRDGILTTEQGRPLSDDRTPSRTERRIEALCQTQCPKEDHES